MYLAQNLKYLRENKGLSQKEFSAMWGLSCAAVGMWETSKRQPDLEMIIKLADYFEVTIDDLLRKDIRPPSPYYSKNLIFLRKKYHCSQKDLAILLKVRQSTISLYETGRRNMSAEDLVLVSDYFGVTLDQLVKQDMTGGV